MIRALNSINLGSCAAAVAPAILAIAQLAYGGWIGSTTRTGFGWHCNWDVSGIFPGIHLLRAILRDGCTVMDAYVRIN